MTRLPEWLKRRHEPSALHEVKSLLREYGLSTVCEEARCPNKGECFSKPTAAFMILGARCTRNCGFCSVEPGVPLPPDKDEPRRIGMAALKMKLKYVVITSVTRDDLPDGGAEHFARTISSIKEVIPDCKVEVLTPDFKGDAASLKTVLDAAPDVFNHNLETVPRLYPVVRPGADYERSVALIGEAKRIAPDVRTKSGLMLGLGERYDEVVDVLRDLRGQGCDFLTVGQYLRPTARNLPVVEYIEPRVFDKVKDAALSMGFSFAASAPLVRSSMNAAEFYGDALDK